MQEKTQGCLKLIFLRQKKKKFFLIFLPLTIRDTFSKRSHHLQLDISSPYPTQKKWQSNSISSWLEIPLPLGDFFKLNTNGFAQGNLGRASARGLIKGAWIDGFYISIGLTHSMAPMRWPCPHKKLKTFTSSSGKLLHNLLLVY